MKVWLVMKEDDRYHVTSWVICSIHSSKESAEEAMKVCKAKNTYYDYDVEEHEVLP